MKCTHLPVKLEFHALVATRRSASILMMTIPENESIVYQAKAVVLWNMKSCSVMRETAVFSFSADFISR